MLLRKPNRTNKSVNYVLPCPSGGLNARDSRDKMQLTDAIVMDNYMPLNTQVSLRKGYRKYVPLSCAVKTLVTYNAPDGKDRLFAFGGGTVWDITSVLDVRNLEKTYTGNTWQTCQFKNRLFAVNGVDIPQTYVPDETGVSVGSWEDVSFTGDNLNLTKLVQVGVSKQRLWFVEKGSLTVWYTSGVAEVQGTLIPFDFSTVATKGGHLVAVGCWTQDGGQGLDDLTVFVTSEGEVLVYSGTNPSSADGWILRGVYQISRPLGYDCLLPYQGDLIVLCEAGYLPLSKALSLQNATDTRIAFSDKIRELVQDRIRSNRAKDGWQGIIYSRGGYALFNVPVAQQFEQHVVNTTTGAWCRFTGIRSYCWTVFQTRLYFGTDNGVMLFDEGYSDDGQPIVGVVEQAFSDLGSPYLKKAQLMNPRTKSSLPYALTVYWNTDYQSVERKNALSVGDQKTVLWNQVKWSSLKDKSGTLWATLKGRIRSQWIGCNATGFKLSLVFKTKTKGTLIDWYETGVRYEQGTGIL